MKFSFVQILIIILFCSVCNSQTIINKNASKDSYYLSDSIIIFNLRLNGKKDGWWKTSFLLWRVSKIQQFKNGIKDGEIVKFRYNGKQKMSGSYKNGKKNGNFIFYKNNKARTYTRYFYENGKRKFKYPPEGHQAL